MPVVSESVKALLPDVILKSAYLLSGCFDALSEGVIIPLSGVSKSGAGSSIHAGGAGSVMRWHGCGTADVELQLLTAIDNITLKNINLVFRISKFLRVFLVQIGQ